MRLLFDSAVLLRVNNFGGIPSATRRRRYFHSFCAREFYLTTRLYRVMRYLSTQNAIIFLFTFIALCNIVLLKEGIVLFPDRLKKLRKELGLSQEAFAKEIKAGQSTVAGWESGKREPNMDMLGHIADYFGVSLDYLFGRVDLPNEHFIPKEKLPTELVDSGVDAIVATKPDFEPEEIAALKNLVAELRQQQG